jgi:hypothetical protein
MWRAMVSLFLGSETITLFFGFGGGRGGALNDLALDCFFFFVFFVYSYSHEAYLDDGGVHF